MKTDEGETYIFTKSIKLKNGKVLIAAHYGLQAFRIKVKRPPKAA